MNDAVPTDFHVVGGFRQQAQIRIQNARTGGATAFDDLTLLYTGGAGSKAMALAFEEMFGVPDGFAKVEWAGRTDVAILRDALALHSIDGDFAGLLEPFKREYFQHLERTLPETKGHLMPGVHPLLEELSKLTDVRLGLATGNFRGSGERKLRHYGIRDYFRDGGFADDSEERAQIVAIAARRMAGDTAGPHQVVVVGDTPHDIASAKANGALAVGVATGPYGVDDLAQAGAQIVLPDFSDRASAVAKLLG